MISIPQSRKFSVALFRYAGAREIYMSGAREKTPARATNAIRNLRDVRDGIPLFYSVSLQNTNNKKAFRPPFIHPA
jgi:hypothetical protein